MVVLDFGSGNTCRNSWPEIKRMIDDLAKIDSNRKAIIKWQLFEKAGENVPLEQEAFLDAFLYARDLGFKTTASVFDIPSLGFLLQFDVPFVKLANRRDLDYLVGEVPRKTQVLLSCGSLLQACNVKQLHNVRILLCVSKYPSALEDYEEEFGRSILTFEKQFGISDHTDDLRIWRKYKPDIYECHFKLPDSTGLDAGPFAKTPDQVKEILG